MNTSMGSSTTRKRLLSFSDDSVGPAQRKRARVSNISAEFQLQLMGGSISMASGPDRLPRTRVLHSGDDDFLNPQTRPLSGSSSFTAGSRACSPGDYPDQPGSSAFISRSGMALMRSVSSASLSSTSTAVPSYPEFSAKYHLRNTKITIDFSSPASAADPFQVESLLSCSSQNILLFSRGNRVHYKNLTTSEEVGQLCKLQDTHGDLKIIECARGADQPELVALATSKGLIQLWDVQAKKKTASWSTKSVTVMRWNGPVLTVGGLKGTIRHYDTRIVSTSKMKEQARKVTRHQTRITSLDWNADGKILASGDQSGMVYCWDSRDKVPLDVGEFVQRRKKMQHFGAVSALAWCPWQPKMLASGDTQGTIQLWSVNVANGTAPGKLELGAPVSGLHFSPHCKELLSTHGSPPAPAEGTNGTQGWPKVSVANSIAVHSCPSLRHVTTLTVADKPIGASVLNANGTKILLALPEASKINVCDVWSKRKDLKRQSSFLNSTIR